MESVLTTIITIQFIVIMFQWVRIKNLAIRIKEYVDEENAHDIDKDEICYCSKCNKKYQDELAEDLLSN